MQDQRIIKGDITKELLFKATMELFKEKGLGKISTVAIAKIAQVGRATIYHHFNKLDDLIFYSLLKELSQVKWRPNKDTRQVDFLLDSLKKLERKNLGQIIHAAKQFTFKQPHLQKELDHALLQFHQGLEKSLSQGSTEAVSFSLVSLHFTMILEWMALQPNQPLCANQLWLENTKNTFAQLLPQGAK